MTKRLATGELFGGSLRIERALPDRPGRTVYEVVREGEHERRALHVFDAIDEEAELGARLSAAKQVDHAGVVRVFDGGLADGRAWILAELFDGQPLHGFLGDAKPERERTKTVLREVALAMAALHDAGFVHGRWTSDDLIALRAPTGELVVKLDPIGGLRGARSPWSAPEVGGPTALAPSADVWSYGLLVLALLDPTGDGAADPETRASAPALPSGFGPWMAGTTARRSELRFQSVGDAWAALEPILAGQGDRVFDAPLAARVPIPPRSKAPVVLGLVAFGSLGFVLLVASHAFRDADPPEASAEPTAVAPRRAAPSAAARTVDYDPLPPLVASSAPAVPSAVPDPVADAVDACNAAADLECLRGALEPSVFTGRAPEEHAQILYDVCEAAHDRGCMTKIVAKYTIDATPGRARKLPLARTTKRGFGDLRGLPGSVAPRARTLIAAHDLVGARALLGPRVFQKIATIEEVRMLLDVCGAQRDDDCTANVSLLYPGIVLR
jgi:hypothetical protein